MSIFSKITILILLSATGIALLLQLPVNREQEIQGKKMTVSAQTSGINPLNTEQNVTSKIEAALSSVSLVKKISSISTGQSSQLFLEFDDDADLKKKRLEIYSILRQIYPKLPVNTSFPVISFTNNSQYEAQNNETNKELLIYDIVITDQTGNQKYFDKITYEYFKDIEGIENIRISGKPEIIYEIQYEPEKLKFLNITKADIQNKISENFDKLFLNYFTENTQNSIVLKTDFELKPENLSNLIIKNDISVRLKDIAIISLKEKEPKDIYRINGKNSVRLLFYSKKNIDNRKVAENIKQRTIEITIKTNGNIKFVEVYDATLYGNKKLDKTIIKLIISLTIVFLFFILLFRKIIPAIKLTALIISILAISGSILYFSSLSINIYAISAYIISLGFISGNFVLYILFGKSKNIKRLKISILVLNLIISSALIFSYLNGTEIVPELKDFSKVIIANLLTSVLLIYFIDIKYITNVNIKTLNFKTLRKLLRISNKYFNFYLKYRFFRYLIIMLPIFLVGIPIYKLPEKIENPQNISYINLYNNTLGSVFFSKYIKHNIENYLGGLMRIFDQNSSEYQESDIKQRTRLYINMSSPPETSLQSTEQTIKTIEDFLSNIQGIELFTASIHKSSASVEICFKEEYENTKLPFILKQNLEDYSRNLSGADWDIYGVGRAYTARRTGLNINFIIETTGYNYGELQEFSNKIANSLTKNKRVDDIKIRNGNIFLTMPEQSDAYFLDFNNFELAKNKISKQEIVQLLSDYNIDSEPSISNYSEYGKHDILIIPKKEKLNLYQLLNEQKNISGNSIKIEQITDIERIQTDRAIIKIDKNYLQTIFFSYIGSYEKGNEITQKIIKEAENETRIGYKAKNISFQDFNPFSGEEKEFPIWLYFIITCFVIAAVANESIKLPLLSFYFAISSFIGIFLTFLVWNISFDEGGKLAFLLAFGFSFSIFNLLNGLKTRKKSNFRLLHSIISFFPYIIVIFLSLIPFFIFGNSENFFFPFAVSISAGLFSNWILLFITRLSIKQNIIKTT